MVAAEIGDAHTFSQKKNDPTTFFAATALVLFLVFLSYSVLSLCGQRKKKTEHQVSRH